MPELIQVLLLGKQSTILVGTVTDLTMRIPKFLPHSWVKAVLQRLSILLSPFFNCLGYSWLHASQEFVHRLGVYQVMVFPGEEGVINGMSPFCWHGISPGFYCLYCGR